MSQIIGDCYFYDFSGVPRNIFIAEGYYYKKVKLENYNYAKVCEMIDVIEQERARTNVPILGSTLPMIAPLFLPIEPSYY